MLEGQFYSVSYIDSDLLEKLNCFKLGSKMVLRQNWISCFRIPQVVLFSFYVTSVTFIIYLNMV